MTAPLLHELEGHPGVTCIVDTRGLAVYPACRCGWRSYRGTVAGSPGWRQWVARDFRTHTCTADKEKPS